MSGRPRLHVARSFARIAAASHPFSGGARVRLASTSRGAVDGGGTSDMQAGSSLWAVVPKGEPDPILGMVETFKADNYPLKVSLLAGAYRDAEGQGWVLPSVLEAEERVVASRADKEYLPMLGLSPFREAAVRFALGDKSAAIREQRVASAQTLGRTGACRLAGDFFARFLAPGTPVYLPAPSWSNHARIFKAAGLDVRSYRYWDADALVLDFDGMLKDLAAAPEGSAVLLHACGHNPTGLDLTRDEWGELSAALRGGRRAILFDSAYQGFASGDAENDAYAIRLFEREGHSFAVAQSFAKNFGLYGERVGALSFVCGDVDEKDRLESQLERIIRPSYSSPPLTGARIVAEVLNDSELYRSWRRDCAAMAHRIRKMRVLLQRELLTAGSTRDWEHLTEQIGMFCYTGLTAEQVDVLRDEFHIYLTMDGRASMTGLNPTNVGYVASAIHFVTHDPHA